MRLNDKQIAALEEKGFKRWTKGNMDRLYIDAEILGLEVNRNKSGNVSGAYYRGERISNSLGTAMARSKTYIDIATGELTSGNWTLEQDARQLYEETMEALEATENEEDATMDQNETRTLTAAEIEQELQDQDIDEYVAYLYAQEAAGTPDPLNPDRIAAFVAKRDAEIAAQQRWDEEHREEYRLAHEAGNEYPRCDIERYCRENGIEPPADMDTASALFTQVFNERWSASRNTAWGTVWFGVLDDWRDGNIRA